MGQQIEITWTETITRTVTVRAVPADAVPAVVTGVRSVELPRKGLARTLPAMPRLLLTGGA